MSTTSAITEILTPSQPSRTYKFSFTPFLRTQNLTALVSTVPLCPTYSSTNSCPLGRRCPNRHPTPSQTHESKPFSSSERHYHPRSNDNFVCKHWLKGLCKKGDACDYLHEYNLRKMSECQFYNQNGYCQNGDECLYVHVKEGSKLPVCEDYAAGFCERGPKCPKRHVRRRLCVFYLAGFCPDGKECVNGVHLKSALAVKERERGVSPSNVVGNNTAPTPAAAFGVGAVPGSRDVDMDDENARFRKDRGGGDADSRDDGSRKDYGWRGGRGNRDGGRGGGRGGRWKNKQR